MSFSLKTCKVFAPNINKRIHQKKAHWKASQSQRSQIRARVLIIPNNARNHVGIAHHHFTREFFLYIFCITKKLRYKRPIISLFMIKSQENIALLLYNFIK